MRELVFQVEFKSDVVLPATSNTEGRIEQLDFIAGSNFLGMAARKYPEFKNPFDMFHSGKVRFGDAHLLKNGKMTYKMPLSIFKEKNDEHIIVNQIKDSIDSLKQAKQLREGYITKDRKKVFAEYVYSQKSAHDKKHRRSKESGMYGYNALKKGSKWQFAVKLDEGIGKEDEALLVKTLESSNRLGKSRSAEYGKVAIKHLPDAKKDDIASSGKNDDEVVLYCNSRLALVDEKGNPTYNLTTICERLDKDNINYDKTQLRTSTFTPYNGARKTKDYERLCINKGSVIVLKSITNEQLAQIQKGVGAFLSEGFGEIIINPQFLMQEGFAFEKEETSQPLKDTRQKITQTFSDRTVQFLANRHNQKIDTLDLAKEVAEFVKKHKKSTFAKIKPSQWGKVRSIAASNEDDFLQEIKEYISNGSKKWEEKQIKVLIGIVEQHATDKRYFTRLLAMKMGGDNE